MCSLSHLEPHGLVHLYTGDGKGKTTAAVGLAVRALGAGKSVMFCQFLKGRESGELSGLETLGARLLRAECGEKFVFQMDEREREKLAHNHRLCFDEVKRRVFGGEADVVLLDEIIDAVNEGLVPEKDLLELVGGRPAKVELVLTGRNPGGNIVAAADYHTDFVCVKHPYQNGVRARKGIEY